MIKLISFEEILPLWKKLWPNTELIKPYNEWEFLGGYNSEVPCSDIWYIGYYNDQELVGCNSCFMSSKEHLRSRGIYILPEHRGKGISKALFTKTFEIAETNNAVLVWSYPRLTALPSYKAAGFNELGNPFDDFDYGPNIWVAKYLKNID
jgi:GNAT superfamily N-acetyltransferase